MSRPPRKAIVQIKNYCEKTQCRRCIYGDLISSGYEDYVGCELQMANPCDWETEEDKQECQH